MQPYTPSDTWHSTILLAEDSDSRNRTVENTPLEALADNVTHVHTGIAAVQSLLANATHIHHAAVPCPIDTAVWQQTDPGPVFTDAGATGDKIAFPMTLPIGATLNHVRAYIKGSAGHAALPAVMPKLQAFKLAVETGVITQLGSDLYDPATPKEAYEVAHNFGIVAAFAEVVAVNYVYYIVITGESGANSQVGMLLYPPSYTFSAANYAGG